MDFELIVLSWGIYPYLKIGPSFVTIEIPNSIQLLRNLVLFLVPPLTLQMSLTGIVNVPQEVPRNYSFPSVQDPITDEFVRAVCHENAIIRHDISEKARQLEQDTIWWRGAWTDVVEE